MRWCVLFKHTFTILAIFIVIYYFVLFKNSRVTLFIYIFHIKPLDKCSKSLTGGVAGDGDGTDIGNCRTIGQFCYNDMVCSNECSKSIMDGLPGDGDGALKGNCPDTNDFCYTTGICDGMYYSNIPLQYWSFLL